MKAYDQSWFIHVQIVLTDQSMYHGCQDINPQTITDASSMLNYHRFDYVSRNTYVKNKSQSDTQIGRFHVELDRN
jgi:hypothetical protein